MWAKRIVKSWHKTTTEVYVNFGVHQSKYQEQYWKRILIGVGELHREKQDDKEVVSIIRIERKYAKRKSVTRQLHKSGNNNRMGKIMKTITK